MVIRFQVELDTKLLEEQKDTKGKGCCFYILGRTGASTSCILFSYEKIMYVHTPV
jgi:hypothetical protein